MELEITEIINEKNLAVVGVSDKKFGGTIYRELKKRGYGVVPVNPSRDVFDGDRCYRSLVDLPDTVQAAVVAVAPHSAMTIVDDARVAGLTHLWFQQGRDFSDAEREARRLGIRTVTDKCILMYAGPVGGIHAIHRFFVKILGRL